MSVLVALRLPDELAASVDEEAKNRGKNRSQIIIEAVMEHQRRGGAKVSLVIEDEKLKARATKRREIESAKAPEVLAVSGGCRKHPGSGFSKAGGWWCSECGRIV